MGSAAARELAERERKYARLHHLKRVHELEQRSKLDMTEREMLRQSRRELDDPLITRCVDLSDSAYLAELDAFATLPSAPASTSAQAAPSASDQRGPQHDQ